MTYPLRVAVFCGFTEPKFLDEQSDEVLFVYRVLQLFNKAELDSTADNPQQAVDELLKASHYETPLFGKFNFFKLPPKEKNFTHHLIELLSDDRFDYALVIMPHRRCSRGENGGCKRSRTTPFVPMEYALAEGLGKCPVAVIEEGVPEHEVPLVERKTWVNISKDNITDARHWKKLHQCLREMELLAVESNKMHFGLNTSIEDFYLRFCRYILTARQVQIFNHSLLPLGGNFDQNDTGNNYQLIQEEPLCARDLYFELEEALLSESNKRINRLLNEAANRREWGDLEKAINQRIAEFSKNNQKTFWLQRVVSVPDAELFGQEAVPQDVLLRYTSLFRQIGRIEKRQVEATKLEKELQIHYALAAFQTRTLHSFPTTVHITHENNARSCIWGFLRSYWGDKVKEDHFIVARNSSIVNVLQQHVGMFFDGYTISSSQHVHKEPLKYLLKERGWNSRSVQVACAELASLIHQNEVCVNIAKELQKEFHEPEAGFAAWLDSAARGEPTARP